MVDGIEWMSRLNVMELEGRIVELVLNNVYEVFLLTYSLKSVQEIFKTIRCHNEASNPVLSSTFS